MLNASSFKKLVSMPQTVNSESKKLEFHPETSGNAKVMPVYNEESEMWIDSSIGNIDDGNKLNIETEADTLVTITIYESEGLQNSNRSEATRSPLVEVTKSIIPPDYTTIIRQCFQCCLKLSSGTWTSLNNEDISGSSDEVECSSENAEMSCFLCSDTFFSYNKLKDHLVRDHSLINDSDLLSNPSSKFIGTVTKELKLLECRCLDFKCDKCTGKFKLLSPLMLHVLFEHPHSYVDIPFFKTQRSCESQIRCQRCTILGKLHVANYHLFIHVLLELEGCFNDTYTPLLQWSSSSESFDNFDDFSVEAAKGKLMSSDQVLSSDTNVEVVCYSVLQQPGQSLVLQGQREEDKWVTSECICPLLKCPACPKTTTNFKDLRRHIRLNDHNTWNGLKLLWRKYKLIRDNCPACPRYPYLSYILCPHCPHLAFEDECAAQSHMDMAHCMKDDELGESARVDCTCSKHFTCLTCDTQHRTPQELHHHMRNLGHETQTNFDAIPGMMEKRMEEKKKCLRCSRFTSTQIQKRKTEDQDQCSCVWAICDTCGNSYKKISELMDHMRKSKHPVNMDYIEREQKKVSSSFKTCRRCYSMEDRYCIFCNKRENFIFYHIKTQHQDQQILLLSRDDCTLIDEFDVTFKSKETSKYECSICLQRFLHTTTLRRHVRKIHPDCFFTLQCLDLSQEKLNMNDFTNRKEMKVLAVASKSCASLSS